jgi:branched-chain amino acid transport system ATP-binding protein
LATSEPLLSLERVNAYYGESHVLHDVNLQLREGRLLALLGRNGAGKTTCICTIIGFLPPRSGRITLAGRSIEKLAPERICRAGVGLVPQGRRVFPSLTVRENLEVAARDAAAGSAKVWRRDDVCQIFPRLKERQNQLAGSLSGGEQQMLALGRVLLHKPEIVLIDELSLGLAPIVVQRMLAVVERLKAQGQTMVIVEQSLNVALSVADRAIFLEKGTVRFEGLAADLLARDDLVRAVFFGTEGG